MDIRRINRNVGAKLYDNSKKESVSKNKTQNDNCKTGISDKINISPEAKNLNILDFAKTRIKNDLNSDASASAEKIRIIKEQVKSGTYRVDSRDIADSIINGKEK